MGLIGFVVLGVTESADLSVEGFGELRRKRPRGASSVAGLLS